MGEVGASHGHLEVGAQMLEGPDPKHGARHLQKLGGLLCLKSLYLYIYI